MKLQHVWVVDMEAEYYWFEELSHIPFLSEDELHLPLGEYELKLGIL